jgi:hypothetical protein
MNSAVAGFAVMADYFMVAADFITVVIFSVAG